MMGFIFGLNSRCLTERIFLYTSTVMRLSGSTALGNSGGRSDELEIGNIIWKRSNFWSEVKCTSWEGLLVGEGTVRLCQFIISFKQINMSLVKVDSMRGSYRSKGSKEFRIQVPQGSRNQAIYKESTVDISLVFSHKTNKRPNTNSHLQISEVSII